ncbi:hypothetical protein BC939DRAFT_474192 [Gamsiella multidivaricata]|uniref:uncharacterized protein n=1 Tax=Gamsiella multidivaricata TaxID=101098 RepID=UPI00221F415B|nr:uncharacterized protein BC939DRAFT_474192 [Gamsiella multidivaricata]KAI7829645.1 hypothetical protein BC939DRAFT_474192 [Gamsiella multidivaricata]
MDIYDHFPDRSMTAIESRMSFFRSKEKGNTTTLPNTHKPSKMKRWTPEQDQWLREQVEELGQGDDIPWLEIGTQEVDGMRLGRTPTSCKRRWDIINPFNDRKSGRWDPEELKKLADAVAEQLEQLEDVKSQEAKGRLIDWSIVARKVGTRSDVQCRSHMHKSMQAEIKGRWKEDEVERMKVALQEHGQDWKKIAKVVKTRTPFQVKQKYYMSNARLPRLLNAELRPGSEEPKPAKSTTTNQDTTGA